MKEILIRQTQPHDGIRIIASASIYSQQRFRREHWIFPGIFSWTLLLHLVALLQECSSIHCCARSDGHSFLASFSAISTSFIPLTSHTTSPPPTSPLLHKPLTPSHPSEEPRSACQSSPTTYSNDCVCSLTYYHYLHLYHARTLNSIVSSPSRVLSRRDSSLLLAPSTNSECPPTPRLTASL